MSFTYAIADLHGRLDLLTSALDAIMDDAERRGSRDSAKVVTLGDYIDRGPDSAGIIRTLMEIQAAASPGRIICLRGNHEGIMQAVCAGQAPVRWWLDNGGGQTLLSYGHPPEGYVDLALVTPEHLAWIAHLPLSHVDQHRIFVHAGVDPTIPLEEQTEKTMTWMLYPDGFEGGHGERHVVHGHHQFADGPKRFSGRTDLDTLAWYTGRLVVGVFDDAVPGGPVDLLDVIGTSASAVESASDA